VTLEVLFMAISDIRIQVLIRYETRPLIKKEGVLCARKSPF
jgi:hypothetical protein